MPGAGIGQFGRLSITIGDRVRRFRERAALTRDQLAEKVGISRTSITQFEAGHQNVPLETIYLIALALGVELHELLPSIGDLTSEPMDILGQVNQDQTLNHVEREALLEFFRRHAIVAK